ncbi:MAG: acyl-CoA dehydrogenase family protein [Frankia sp.]
MTDVRAAPAAPPTAAPPTAAPPTAAPSTTVAPAHSPAAGSPPAPGRPRSTTGPTPLERARAVAEIVRSDARATDESATFPDRGLAALRNAGLLGLLVPVEYGGRGGDLAAVVDVARELGGACLSTALIWAMHTQQVAVLVGSATPALRARLLPRVARGEVYIASVTSERGKGGHLLSARQPLSAGPTGYHLDRDAPVVTGVTVADGFLVTMRAGDDAPETSVSLVYVDREQAEVTVTGSWDPMGMRGTESRAARIVADVPADQIVGGAGEFRRTALHPFVTAGHLGWAASWLGTAQGVFREVVAMLRSPGQRKGFDLDSDLLRSRLARVRMLLDATGAFVSAVVTDAAEVDAGRLDPEDPAFQLHVNGLKIAASEFTFDAVNQLIEAVGLRHGYLRDSGVPLERAFRDLRSATLNFSNDRLLVANGWLSLLDRDVRLP